MARTTPWESLWATAINAAACAADPAGTRSFISGPAPGLRNRTEATPVGAASYSASTFYRLDFAVTTLRGRR